jgi:hypothetical protein
MKKLFQKSSFFYLLPTLVYSKNQDLHEVEKTTAVLISVSPLIKNEQNPDQPR